MVVVMIEGVPAEATAAVVVFVEAAVAAAAAAAAAAALSAGCGGKNFRIISLGSFSRGSWCHLVGTGGGTVIEECGGFSKSSVKLGFSEQTTLNDLADGALSRDPEAGRLVPFGSFWFPIKCILTLDESRPSELEDGW